VQVFDRLVLSMASALSMTPAQSTSG